MLGFLVVIVVGAVTYWYSLRAWGIGWAVGCTVVLMLAAWAVLGLLLRRAMMKRQEKIQAIMQEAQNKVNRQLEMFQRRPPSSMNAARQIVEKIQFDAVRRSLAEMGSFDPLCKWNPMIRRQINAMKVQLHYQLREYSAVDKLLPKTLLFDPQTLAISLARKYKNNDSSLDRFYRRRCRRFKGDNAAFLACVYAWIKLKQEDNASALAALQEASRISDHQVLLDNIGHLVNGHAKHFSNSGFNDLWYALALEEPKMKPQRRMAGRGF